jgi:hypothetical protein
MFPEFNNHTLTWDVRETDWKDNTLEVYSFITEAQAVKFIDNWIESQPRSYKIPVSWEMYGYITVQADTLEDAIEMAKDFPLPDGSYIEDSFQIDIEALTVE